MNILIIIIIIGLILGYILAFIFSGRKEGKQGIFPSLRFKYGKDYVHIHHWITALVLLIFIFLKGENTLVMGLLLGVIIQGLGYKDFYRVIYKYSKS